MLKRSVCTTQAVNEYLRTMELHTSPLWRRLDGAIAGKEVTKKAYTKHVANVDDMLHVPLVLTVMERHYEASIIMGLTLRVFM